ncbi:MAG: metallophosphoesterase [Tissierellia bacterium]|nr:metallophosphoesterase [Tissierellia bacterium]
MKIAIISDTHGSIESVISSLKEQKIDLILHLGDYAVDGAKIQDRINIDTIIVRGNNDWGSQEPLEQILEVRDHRVLMLHGHKYNVYFGTDRLYYHAKEEECDMVFYGHTHAYLDENNGDIRIVNPGSPSLPRGDGRRSYLIWNTENDEIKRILL